MSSKGLLHRSDGVSVVGKARQMKRFVWYITADVEASILFEPTLVGVQELAISMSKLGRVHIPSVLLLVGGRSSNSAFLS